MQFNSFLAIQQITNYHSIHSQNINNACKIGLALYQKIFPKNFIKISN